MAQVADSKDNDGRSVLVGGWWGAKTDTPPFVAQPATISVDAHNMTLSACITNARYTPGAPVLVRLTPRRFPLDDACPYISLNLMGASAPHENTRCSQVFVSLTVAQCIG